MKSVMRRAPRLSSLPGSVRRLGPSVCLWALCCGSPGCSAVTGQAPVYQPETNTGTSGEAAGGEATTDIVQQTTEAQVQDCIDECGRSQQQHPEESPYDCRAMCLTGEMK